MSPGKNSLPFLPVIVIGSAVVALTELLSLGHMLTRLWVSVFWIAAILLAARYVYHSADRDGLRGKFASLTRGDWILVYVIVGISAINLFLALIAAPSAWDALSYHSPRVSHWIQNRSVAHYPTHIDRQLWVSPGAEFFSLQLQLLTGSDRLVNLIQWLSSIGCLFTTATIARVLGAGRRGQLLTALFAATIPMAVAQASGAQTDLVASFWVSASAAILLTFITSNRSIRLPDAFAIGACLGLAAFAKGTAYIALAPFVVWFAIVMIRRMRSRALAPAIIAMAMAFAINAGHIARNYKLYGNALTNPRNTPVTNEAMTPGVVLSNVLRNATLHMYTRSRAINDAMYTAVVDAHSAIGLDANDPRSTFYVMPYEVKARPRTEARVGNHFHFAVIAVVLVLIFARRPGREPVMYAAALCIAYLVFCALLKWQPWNSRLQLPLFVLGSAAVGFAVERFLSRRAGIIVAALMVMASLPILLRNTARPIASRNAIWTVPREQRSFIETNGLYETHAAAADFLAANKCSRVGLLTSWVDFENLVWVTMRNRSATPVEIRHAFMSPDEPSKSPPAPAYDPLACAIVRVYSTRVLTPKTNPITPEWRLAFQRWPVEVYLRR